MTPPALLEVSGLTKHYPIRGGVWGRQLGEVRAFAVQASQETITDEDRAILAQEVDQLLESLAADNQLGVYRHDGFWAAMDTLRDKNVLEQLWESNKAPWKVWE